VGREFQLITVTTGPSGGARMPKRSGSLWPVANRGEKVRGYSECCRSTPPRGHSRPAR